MFAVVHAVEPSSPRRFMAIGVAAVLVVSGCVGATRVSVEAGSTSDAETVTTLLAEVQPAVDVPACVGELTVEQKAAEMLMVLVDTPGRAAPLVSQRLVGGYGLVGDQAAEVAGQVAMVGSVATFPLLVSSDEEGGTVQRLKAALGELPAARSVAESMSVGDATLLYRNFAAKMKAAGFSMNFAPVLDIGTGAELGTRTFGNDATTVKNYGLAAMQAMTAAGVIPVVKHWPGLGTGGADPHKAAVPLGTFEELRTNDLVPFEQAIALDAPAIMVSHGSISQSTGGLPASISREAITELLRGDQRFDGLVITDSLGMSAVTMHVPESQAAMMAISAGADIALVSKPEEVQPAHDAITGAISGGLIDAQQVDASVARVLRAKGVTGACPALAAPPAGDGGG